LVLRETGMGAETLVAGRICEQLAREAERPRFSVSVGVASYPRHADTIGTLLVAEDPALYAMKDKQARAAGAGQAAGTRETAGGSCDSG